MTYITSNGYRKLRLPEHPNADSKGEITEHRVVMAAKLGRPLRRGEVVHHINGDRLDNRPENLEVFASPGKHTAGAHTEIHDDEVLLLLAAGWSSSEVQTFGVSTTRIARARKRLGLPRTGFGAHLPRDIRFANVVLAMAGVTDRRVCSRGHIAPRTSRDCLVCARGWDGRRRKQCGTVLPYERKAA